MDFDFAQVTVSSRDAAKRMMLGIDEACAALEAAAEDTRSRLSSEQYGGVRRGVGTLLSGELFQFYMALLRQHPELDEDGLLSSRSKAHSVG